MLQKKEVFDFLKSTGKFEKISYRKYEGIEYPKLWVTRTKNKMKNGMWFYIGFKAYEQGGFVAQFSVASTMVSHLLCMNVCDFDFFKETVENYLAKIPEQSTIN